MSTATWMTQAFSHDSFLADVYYIALGTAGSMALIAAARGAYPKTRAMKYLLFMLVLPLLFIHQLVIPDYVGSWALPEISLTAHIMSGMPVNIALFMAIQNTLDAQGETRRRRIGAIVGIGFISAMMVMFNPSPETVIATIALNLLSMSIPVAYELRRG